MAHNESELPDHSAERITAEETPQSPIDSKAIVPRVLSPAPVYSRAEKAPGSPRRRERDYSPEPADRLPGDFEYLPERERERDREERPGGGVRRRPSALVTNGGGSGSKRPSDSAEYDRPYYSAGGESRRRLRSRDDDYYRGSLRDNERDYASDREYRPYRKDSKSERDRDWEREDLDRHVDHENRKPPRAHQNSLRQGRQLPERKQYIEETKIDYYEPDTPRKDGRRRRLPDEESLDGYDYEGQRRTLNLQDLSPAERKEVMRLPWMTWMNSNAKNHFVATLGEFIGTTMFLFFAFAGTQVANIQSQASDSTPSTSGSTSGGATGFNISVYLYIAFIFGFSLMVNVWVFFRISGGLFNPAVTLGMVLVGAIPPLRALFLFLAQIVGGIAASAMVKFMFPTQFNVRTTLAGGTSLVQGVFIEAFLTAELVFTIFMLAKEKHKATFIAPVGIGLALFISEMVGVYYTGGSLNPARSFGPCAVTGIFDHEHWIYWVGPCIGTLIAVFFYKFIKMLEYEMANPGQDGDDKNNPLKNKEKAAEVIRHESRYNARYTVDGASAH